MGQGRPFFWEDLNELMSSNALRVVLALSQHHTGNAGNIDSHVVNLGQFCPGTVESRGVRVEEERSTGERSRQECCGG